MLPMFTLSEKVKEQCSIMASEVDWYEACRYHQIQSASRIKSMCIRTLLTFNYAVSGLACLSVSERLDQLVVRN